MVFRPKAADHKWTNIPKVIRPRLSLAAGEDDNFQDIQATTCFSLDFEVTLETVGVCPFQRTD